MLTADKMIGSQEKWHGYGVCMGGNKEVGKKF
jgi:hypothetical protein